LYDIDHRIGADRIAQAIPVTHQFTVNEHHHVLPDLSLLVEHISPRSLVMAEVILENGAEC